MNDSGLWYRNVKYPTPKDRAKAQKQDKRAARKRHRQWLRANFTRWERVKRVFSRNTDGLGGCLGYSFLALLMFLAALTPVALIIALIVAVVRNFW